MSIDTLAAHLKEIFGDRLRMLAAFSGDANTCAVVRTLTLDDLDRCAAHETKWAKLGLDAPLLLSKPNCRARSTHFPSS